MAKPMTDEAGKSLMSFGQYTSYMVITYPSYVLAVVLVILTIYFLSQLR